MGSEPTIFLVACIVSLGLTALIREIAPRIGLTDNPDGHRKLHGKATPLGGGVAVYLTTAIILGMLWFVPGHLESSQQQQAPTSIDTSQSIEDNDESADAVAPTPTLATPSPRRQQQNVRAKLKEDCPALPGLLLAGLVIVVVGLIDDAKGMPGKVKLLGQTVAVLVLIFDGLLIKKIGILGHEYELFPLLSYPLTMLWMLGAINALNLLDGIDGLATMLGIILSCTIAAMAAVIGHHGVVIVAMVFASSLLGFMRFNFPPASIFLGDTGSMLIGLMVGSMAIFASLKGPGTVLLAAPLAVWTIPFFDVIAAIIRRKLTGRSIYATDRGHLHHRLLHLLGSNRKVLGWLAFCCAVIAIATLVGLVRKDDRIVLLTCLAIVLIFIVTGAFGRVELLLVGTRISRVGRKLISPIFPCQSNAWQVSIQLQGSQQWNHLWDALVESADKLRLCSIRLDINLPTVHESFHASWEHPQKPNADKCWCVEVPLVANGHLVGRVNIQGESNGHSACQDIQQLAELIEPLEVQINAIAAHDESSKLLPEERQSLEVSSDEISTKAGQHPK